MKTNKNDLFYICSLIESVSRESGNSKAEIVDILGEKKIKRLYKFAEVNHCLPIEQVTDEVINLNQINRKEKTKQKRKQSINLSRVPRPYFNMGVGECVLTDTLTFPLIPNILFYCVQTVFTNR